MTATTQHISPNPALDFAKGILEETNGALELIEILRDIADGVDEKATTNDRIAANTVLADRGLGKCPKQPPAPGPNPNPAPETNTKEPIAHDEPESPRLVTQIDNSLNQSIGPAPSAHTEPALSLPKGHSRESGNPESFDTSDSPEQNILDPFNPYSIHLTIQRHILAITNNGQTIRDNLLEIARAEDDPKACPEQRRRITTYHRRRAAILLIDRVLGTDPNALRSAVCPECRRKWTTHPGSHDHPVSDRKVSPGRKVRYIDPEALAEVRAEIQRMKDEGILTPDPNAPKIDISMYRMPKDFDATPYAKEAAAKFWADVELRLERQKQWPAIEERRRKKLAQIYPSYSDDKSSEADPPDT